MVRDACFLANSSVESSDHEARSQGKATSARISRGFVTSKENNGDQIDESGHAEIQLKTKANEVISPMRRHPGMVRVKKCQTL